MNILFYPPKKKDLIDRVAQRLPDLTILAADDEEELRARIGETDILVTSNRPYTALAARIVRESGGRLKWIHFTTSGIDNGLAYGLPDHVPVTNSAGYHANRIAQHAFTFILALARRFNDAAEARRRHAWIHDEILPHMVSLERATLVVIGLGSVGQEIARKAKAFDMRVIGISRSSAALAHIDEIRPRERLTETLREADVLVLSTSYDEATHHLVDATAIAALKPRAIVVNVARGLLLDEQALIEALKAGRIGGAGMDVMAVEPLPADSPLWDLPNVMITPHVSSGGGDDQVEPIFAIIQENFTRLKAGQPMIKLAHGPARPRQPA